MYRFLPLLTLLMLLGGCQEKQHKNFDGQKLLEQKCSQCHNLDLPPKTFKDEKAPPMMAVAFHIKDFIPASNESEKVPKAIEFIKDYVIHPSASKSFCDKKSLQTYGVMPSQKGNVTQDELQAIGEYMFEHYTVKNLTAAQDLENRLRKMPKGERLAVAQGCLSCHKVGKDLVGPSFHKIAKHYQSQSAKIEVSIEKGSRGKWKDYHGAIMPAFASKISVKDTQTIAEWIAKQ